MVMGEFTQETDVLVIGGGPGGYAAAFRAADLGMDVTMVEADAGPGGVCLFRGCIPSKTLLYVTELMHDAQRASEMGISFADLKIDLDRLREWKDKVVGRLAKGLVELTKRRGILYLQGKATLEDENHARVQNSGSSHVRFKHAIIATGSSTRTMAGAQFEPGGRIMDSTGALELADIPERLLVVGGGFVGLEIGSVYASLGSKVTLVENNGQLMPGIDRDLSKPLASRLDALFKSIHYNTNVTSIEEDDSGVNVIFDGAIEKKTQRFDRVLAAIGRVPNSQGIGLENTKVTVNERGFIVVDQQRRTTDEKIFAVGDVTGGAMLAHKAMHEGKVAAEVISGMPSAFDFQAVPAVLYTDPQIAVCGLSEEAAKKRGRNVKVTRFPWSASGRAVSMGVPQGMTKMIIDPETQRVLGVGIVGREAGEMISEGVLAIEMGALAEDVGLSIHPHPTLSESEEEAAEAFLGSSTHILPQKR
ncbi:lipoamide dehydrogenase, E3 component is part of three enzyme complexes [Syntrophobacter sp. SbD1]|nr:lipoamide dehydrogenase, E3 component is part of three enzyme complexes [Syntrophobacter sp. SbD1]